MPAERTPTRQLRRVNGTVSRSGRRNTRQPETPSSPPPIPSPPRPRNPSPTYTPPPAEMLLEPPPPPPLPSLEQRFNSIPNINAPPQTLRTTPGWATPGMTLALGGFPVQINGNTAYIPSERFLRQEAEVPSSDENVFFGIIPTQGTIVPRIEENHSSDNSSMSEPSYFIPPPLTTDSSGNADEPAAITPADSVSQQNSSIEALLVENNSPYATAPSLPPSSEVPSLISEGEIARREAFSLDTDEFSPSSEATMCNINQSLPPVNDSDNMDTRFPFLEGRVSTMA